MAACTPKAFTTKRRPFFGAAPAKPGSVTVEGIPPGLCASQARHDMGGNGRVRGVLFAMPAEEIGASRGARIRLGAPSSGDAAMDVSEPATATWLRLRHLGP